ncbi:MAG: hypothetical protein U9N10_11800 [Bacillota bacterium]|nr:hypothetical protein [Bacillota bacterium]
MIKLGTGSWQILNIVVLISVIFGILYYVIQNFRRQKRIEKKLNEIVEHLKNNSL